MEAHIFPKDFKPKVNTLARLEFELAFYDVTVQHINHYVNATSPDSRSHMYTYGIC